MRKACLLAAALGTLGVAACNQVFGIENATLVAADSGDAGSEDSDTDASSSADSAPVPPSERLYPLGLGYTWSYEITPVNAGGLCAQGMRNMTVSTGPTTLDGKQAYNVDVICAAAGAAQTIAPDPASNTVYLRYDNQWVTLLDGVLSDGHTWQYPTLLSTVSVTWQRMTNITVPAGTFIGCWTAKQNPSMFTTYCPGVGPVYTFVSDLSGNGYEAKLTKVNFTH